MFNQFMIFFHGQKIVYDHWSEDLHCLLGFGFEICGPYSCNLSQIYWLKTSQLHNQDSILVSRFCFPRPFSILHFYFFIGFWKGKLDEGVMWGITMAFKNKSMITFKLLNSGAKVANRLKFPFSIYLYFWVVFMGKIVNRFSIFYYMIWGRRAWLFNWNHWVSLNLVWKWDLLFMKNTNSWFCEVLLFWYI